MCYICLNCPKEQVLEHKELYEFSKDLNDFYKGVEDLSLFHFYRYKYFVDNSSFEDPDRECKYVIRTRDFGEKQKELLKSFLVEKRCALDSLIERL